MASFGNKKRVAFWKPGGRLPSIRKFVPPPPQGSLRKWFKCYWQINKCVLDEFTVNVSKGHMVQVSKIIRVSLQK